jgi:spermidine synthase
MWKTIFGRCIYQSRSGFKVFQNSRYRWLTIDNKILQTLINRHRPETACLKYIDLLTQMVKIFPGNCCLLGLGGAGIVHALQHKLGDNQIIAVENSPEVIEIAHQYFNLKSLPTLTVINENAQDFIQRTTENQFHHLIVDLHNGEDYPEECCNELFFSQCKTLLKADGILTMNVLNIQTKHSLFAEIKNQFRHCTLVIPVKNTSNTLIFATNSSSPKPLLQHLVQKGLIQKVVWDQTWGLIAQKSGK